MKWHNEDASNQGTILFRSTDGKMSILRGKDSKNIQGTWITIRELYQCAMEAEYVVRKFEEWESDECPGIDCPHIAQVKLMLKERGKSESEIQEILKSGNPEIISCGKKSSDICKCWSKKYRKELR